VAWAVVWAEQAGAETDMAADILTTLATWSTTEGSNQPTGTTAIGTNLDDNLRMIQSVVRYTMASDTIASATTTDLGTKESQFLTVSGTTTITSLGTISAGITKYVTFSGALTLTHNATSLILPGAANITTAAGDTGRFLSLGSGNWKCLSFNLASGRSVVSSPQMSDGTVSLPGMPFASDLDSGVYRIGANNWALAAGGTQVMEFTTTKAIVPVAFSAGPSECFKIDADGSLTFLAPAASGSTTMRSGANLFEIYGHTTGGGRITMDATNVSMYAGNNIPYYLTCQGTGSIDFSSNGVGSGFRYTANTGQLTVVEVIGKPTITSGSGSPAGTISGTDQAFKVTLGTSPGTALVIGFNHTWANAPMVFARLNANINCWVSAVSTTSVTITFASAPSTSGVVDVWCIGYQVT
jgi:hypothetical protein